jgi:hypothetical protein
LAESGILKWSCDFIMISVWMKPDLIPYGGTSTGRGCFITLVSGIR